MISEIRKYIKGKFNDEATGHDWHHIERVEKMALVIAEKEGGDKEIISLAALLHDIDDHKFNGGDFDKGSESAKTLLKQYNYSEKIINQVASVVKTVSFKGALVADETESIEAKIVQDADRIDAIGAIGIARTFAYGGSIGQPIYLPNTPPKLHDDSAAYSSSRTHTINHFYEKLLLLKDRLHTNTAKEIASERHEYMLEFLRRFEHEWRI